MFKWLENLCGLTKIREEIISLERAQLERERRIVVDVCKLRDLGKLADLSHLKEAVDAISERLHGLAEYENRHIAKLKELDSRLDVVKNNCAIVQVVMPEGSK